MAVIDATPADSTLNALDQVNGGKGTNSMTLNMVGAAALPSGIAISNVQTINVRGFGAVTLDLAAAAGITGVTTLNSTQSTTATLTAANTTDVNVSGATDAIDVAGGKNVVISDATADKAIVVGESGAGSTNAAGTITVTDTKQGTGTIAIDGGTTVTVNTTATATNGAITIGANKAATGAVSVTSNLNGDGMAAINQADITITGGSTVTVNSNLTITAKDELASTAHTFGDVTVTGDGKTSSVTVNQTYAATEFTKAAVAVVKELHTVTFKALAAGENTSVDSLTFTASKALTAAEVAQAFSNLTASDLQTSGGKVANGVFSGQLSANFTSGAANGAVVVFTAKDDSEALSLTAGAVDPTETVVAGTAGSAAATSTNTVTYGAVRVDDAAVASITTLTVNGYSSADLGSTSANDLNALTTLSLANSGGTATVDTSAATLGLTVNKVNNDVDLSGAASLKTLNVTATGAKSTFGLIAAAVETLTVAGDKVLDIDTGSTLTALKTVTVTGSAGLSIDATGLANQTGFITTGTTGAVTATIDGAKATYTGGEGVDTVIFAATTVAKNVTLGGGNDTLNGSAATLTGTFTADGGTGTNTLVLDDAQAATLSASATFEGKISNFSKLSLGQVATTVQSDVNLANLDDISYVISAGSVDTAQVKTLTLTVDTAIVADNTVSLTINGTTYTTAALLAGATAGDIATALNTAVGAAYSVDNTAGVLTVTSATGGITTLSGLTANLGTAVTVGAVSGVEAVTTSQLTLTNMADAGTVELTAAGNGAVVKMTDATGATDSLNLLTTDLVNVNVGTVTANGVETINVTTTDTLTDPETNSAVTLAVKSDKVTTVNVSGAGDLTLGASDSTLTTVDAHTMAGKLTYTASVASLTVQGGTTGDALVAAADDVKLYGNEGADTLTVNSGLRVNVYGGAGADTFIFATGASATLDAYTVINGVATSDVIKLTGADSFSSTKIALSAGADETLLNYANQAIKVLGEDDLGWFQKGGNTYVVMDANNTDGDAFVAGTDMIVMITGQVDLSTASYNVTSNTLEIA